MGNIPKKENLMSTKTHAEWTRKGWLAHSIEWMHTAMRRISYLILLVAMVGWALGTADAVTIKGSPGAAFQIWVTGDLDNNGAPYWDNPTLYQEPGPMETRKIFGGIKPPGMNGNVVWCLTGTGDCARLLHPGPPPGPIPFWGMSYNARTDAGGELDPNFFFTSDPPETLQATLELQLSGDSREINTLGWFETDETGTSIQSLHPLFDRDSSLGACVTFTPTKYFGYYFIDISESIRDFDSGVFTLQSGTLIRPTIPDLVMNFSGGHNLDPQEGTCDGRQ